MPIFTSISCEYGIPVTRRFRDSGRSQARQAPDLEVPMEEIN